MKRLFFLLLALTYLTSTYSQLNLNKGSVSPKKYNQEVAVEFIKNKLIIPVSIDGEQIKFILDTGAPLCIAKEFQEKKKYQVIKFDSIIDANGNKHLTKIVKVNEIKIGNITYKNIPALVIDLDGSVLDCFNTSGLIGSNLFRFGALQIDWNNQKVIITDSYKKLNLKKSEGEKLLINQVQSSPYLTVEINSAITDRLLVDTGSDDFYTFAKKGLKYVQSKGYLKDAVKYESKGSNSIGLFGPDSVASNKLIQIDSLTIGKMAHLHNFYAVTTNDDQSRIGVHLLKQGITTIDYPKNRFFFKLYEEDFKYTYFSFGFSPVIENDKLTIGSIWKQSTADLQGLSVGDEITDIEGFDLSEKSPCDIFFQYKNFTVNKQKIIIHVKKSGKDKIKRVELNRMKLD